MNEPLVIALIGWIVVLVGANLDNDSAAHWGQAIMLLAIVWLLAAIYISVA